MLSLQTLYNLECSLMNKYHEETKKCPTCNKSTNKLSDEMFCYHCHTPFVWDTLTPIKTVKKYVDKEHDDDFMSFYIHISQGNCHSFRIPNDYNVLKRLYKNLFRIQYSLTKYEIDMQEYNKDLRHSFLNNEITNDMFRDELEKRCIEMNDKIAIYTILTDYLDGTFKCINEFVNFWEECLDKWNMAWVYSPMFKTYIELLNNTNEKLSKYKQYKIVIKE